MSLGLPAIKMLWGRAAGRCAHPECRISLFFDEADAGNPTLVGENCHIIAESDNGPRADPNLPVSSRNSYNNLILLCRNHHRIIDDPNNGERDYSVARLQQMKLDHERWVRETLNLDSRKQEDDEDYARIVEGWEQRCHVDDWTTWSGWILSAGQPTLSVKVSDDLRDARTWLLGRVWPGRYSRVEAAFENFRKVLEAFHNCFLEQAARKNHELVTEKFYKIREWDEERYFRLLSRYEFHVDLVQDLMLELTRAGNWVCDEIRAALFRGYRRESGRLMVETGLDENLRFTSLVVHYSADQVASGTPFRGLEPFQHDRNNRDANFGSGKPPS